MPDQAIIHGGYYLEVEKGFNILQCIYIDKDAELTEEEIMALKNTHNKKIELIYVANINKLHW